MIHLKNKPEEKTLFTIEHDNYFIPQQNGFLSIEYQGSATPEIIWKKTNSQILVKSLYSDSVRPLNARSLGQPWNDKKNLHSPDYTENWDFDGYTYYPFGEDILVVPYIWPSEKFRFMMPLIRNENGIYIQHYGLPLGNGKYASPRATDSENFKIRGRSVIMGDATMPNSNIKFGKIAPQLYADTEWDNNAAIVAKIAAYYKPLEDELAQQSKKIR